MADVVDVFPCERCGAVVGDTTKHDEWHQEIDDALLYPVGLLSTPPLPPAQMEAFAREFQKARRTLPNV